VTLVAEVDRILQIFRVAPLTRGSVYFRQTSNCKEIISTSHSLILVMVKLTGGKHHCDGPQ
jgi:hypothetical protein